MLNFKSFLKEQQIANQNHEFKELKHQFPCFLMCPPYYLDNKVPNNVWIKELPKSERTIDIDKAISQWFQMYQCMASDALIYLLPPKPGLQDQVYVANLGIVLPHLNRNTVVMANFTSPPRKGEPLEGIDFFKMMGYDIHTIPTKWEGEADLKYLRDNIYIGGYGIRTEKESLDWFNKNFEMEVIPVRMHDEYLYHFDCLCFPLTQKKVMLCSSLVDRKDLKAVEKVAEVIDVNKKMAYRGITNSVKCGGIIYSHTTVNNYKPSDGEDYYEEREKVDTLSEIAAKNGMEAVFLNISEMEKSGALMSCCFMHLNYSDYLYPSFSDQK